MREHTFEVIAVTGVLLFALFFALRGLTTYPTLWFDEALNVQQARNLAEQGYSNLQTAPGVPYTKPYHMTTGYPVIAPLALLFRLFGFDFGLARVAMIFWVLLFLSAAYLAARDLFGRDKALWSLLLLASFAPVYGNGETVIAEIPALALLFFAVFWLRRAQSGGGSLLTGLLFGLVAAVKPLYIIVAPALVLSAYGSRRSMPWRREWVLWLGFALPVIFYVWTLLPPEAAGAAAGSPLAFWESRVTRGDFFEHMQTNLARMVTESSLLYTLLLSFLLAAVTPWRRIKAGDYDRARLTLGVYGALTLLYFLQNIGWNRYLLAYQAILLFFLPAALARAYALLQRLFTAMRMFPHSLVASHIVVACALGGIVLMQGAHLFCCASIFTSTAAPEFEAFFRRETPSGSVYAVNAAEAAAFIPSSRLYQYFDRLEPASPPMRNLLSNIDSEHFDFLFVSKEDGAVTPYLGAIEARYKTAGEVRGFTLYARR